MPVIVSKDEQHLVGQPTLRNVEIATDISCACGHEMRIKNLERVVCANCGRHYEIKTLQIMEHRTFQGAPVVGRSLDVTLG